MSIAYLPHLLSLCCTQQPYAMYKEPFRIVGPFVLSIFSLILNYITDYKLSIILHYVIFPTFIIVKHNIFMSFLQNDPKI